MEKLNCMKSVIRQIELLNLCLHLRCNLKCWIFSIVCKKWSKSLNIRKSRYSAVLGACSKCLKQRTGQCNHLCLQAKYRWIFYACILHALNQWNGNRLKDPVPYLVPLFHVRIAFNAYIFCSWKCSHVRALLTLKYWLSIIIFIAIVPSLRFLYIRTVFPIHGTRPHSITTERASHMQQNHMKILVGSERSAPCIRLQLMWIECKSEWAGLSILHVASVENERKCRQLTNKCANVFDVVSSTIHTIA